MRADALRERVGPIDGLDWRALSRFWYFVNERQWVWKRRFLEKREKPWTEDPILQTTKFTNVYRELDPGTQYAIVEILGSAKPVQTKIFNVLVYRLIGRATTHSLLGMPNPAVFDPKSFGAALRRVRSSNKSVFTGAYMVSAYNWAGGRDKIANIARIFAQIAAQMPVVTRDLVGAGTSEDAYRLIRELPGFGSFLAFQCLVDLRYPLKNGDRIVPFSNDDWAKAGPGALRGLKVLFPETAQKEGAAMRFLRDTHQDAFKALRLDFPYLENHSGSEIPIDLSNVQNCLCEFHKFDKILHGTGQGRAAYAGQGLPRGQSRLDFVAAESATIGRERRKGTPRSPNPPEDA